MADANPLYGERPYTVQTGGCGELGEYIHVTPDYLLKVITNILLVVIINHNDAEEAPSMRLALETLEELDWCLDQLESLQVQDGEDDKDNKKKCMVT